MKNSVLLFIHQIQFFFKLFYYTTGNNTTIPSLSLLVSPAPVVRLDAKQDLDCFQTVVSPSICLSSSLLKSADLWVSFHKFRPFFQLFSAHFSPEKRENGENCPNRFFDFGYFSPFFHPSDHPHFGNFPVFWVTHHRKADLL